MLLIDHQWVKTPKKLEVRDPATFETVGEVCVAGEKEVADAVAAARRALQNPLTTHQRSQILRRWHQLLSERKEEAARLILREAGKTIRECRTEVDRALITLQLSAEEASRLHGEVLPCDVTENPRHRYAFSIRVPLGVVAAITPFNFPVNIAVHKIGPAFAAGNAVVWKPSPKTPLCANFMGELFLETGCPPGWLNIIHGEAEAALALSKAQVHAVSFTGGTQAAEAIARAAAGKKILLELGGNDPVIVAEDADVEKAAEIIVAHRFGAAGQRCTSCKRVFVHASLLDPLVALLRDKIGRLKRGALTDETTEIGPLISEEAAIRVERQVQGLVAGGAKVLIGGKREKNFFWPTLLRGADPLQPECLEEIFGPVLPVYSFSSLAQVVGWVNASPVGLQAGLLTNNLEHARFLFERLEVGTLILNDGPAFRQESLPFGSLKPNSTSREGVRYALQEFSTTKTLVW